MNTVSRRTFAGLATAALLSIGPAGMNADTASAQDLKAVKFSLLTVPGIWDAGVFAAVDQGYFKEEGLELSFVSPTTPADGLKILAAGDVDFATAHSTEVIVARSKGLEVVSIATNHQQGTAGIMVPSAAGVASLKDLEGLTLGVTGIPYNKVMLEYSLEKAGVDLAKVEIVTVGFTPMPLLLTERINGLGDAITWSEPAMYNVQIDEAADDASTYTYFAFYENGVPRYYTLGVVASQATLDNDPELARAFLRAWTKGMSYAINNQAAAIEGLRTHVPELNEKEAAANLAEIARISQSGDTEAHGLGWQDVNVWAAQEAFMREHGLIENEVDVTKAVTNDYLSQ